MTEFELAVEPAGLALARASFKAHGSPWEIGACEALCQWAEERAPALRAELAGPHPPLPAEFARWLVAPGDMGALWAEASGRIRGLPGNASERAVDAMVALEAMASALRAWGGMLARGAGQDA